MSEDYPRTMQELEKRFSTEEACRMYLAALRWPNGWACPRCGSRQGWVIRRERWRCIACRYEGSVTAGTIFQDSHLPLNTWFRAMWQIASQKNGVSALGLQRVLGLGSYKTAWAMLHKLRRAMVRPGRDRLNGIVEVDETYWGAEEKGVIGRLTHAKALIIVAAEEDGPGIGRIRLRRIPDLAKTTLHGFIGQAVEPGSTVRTDGLNAYMGLEGYVHDRQVQRLAPETLVAGHPSGCGRLRASGLLPRRVHLSIQPPHVGIAGEALLPAGSTGRPGGAHPIQDSMNQPPPMGVGGVK
jgi:transposase-like protein